MDIEDENKALEKEYKTVNSWNELALPYGIQSGLIKAMGILV